MLTKMNFLLVFYSFFSLSSLKEAAKGIIMITLHVLQMVGCCTGFLREVNIL